MPKIIWNDAGSRYYEVGVDRGVLYVGTQPGVPWNGLISVEENSSGGDAKPFYQDGMKYLNLPAFEEFEATIQAFTYPDAFAPCDGSAQPRSGLFLSQQRRKPFGLSYRTKIGNDLSPNAAYKLHLVYNALAAPSSRSNSTITADIDPSNFSWKITTKPPVMAEYRPTAHIVVDSRFTDPVVLDLLDDILYGNESDPARLPTMEELLETFDTISTLTVTDNGDGTFTVTAPYDVIRMLDPTTFEITADTAVFIDAVSYTISSA